VCRFLLLVKKERERECWKRGVFAGLGGVKNDKKRREKDRMGGGKDKKKTVRFDCFSFSWGGKGENGKKGFRWESECSKGAAKVLEGGGGLGSKGKRKKKGMSLEDFSSCRRGKGEGIKGEGVGGVEKRTSSKSRSDNRRRGMMKKRGGWDQRNLFEYGREKGGGKVD